MIAQIRSELLKVSTTKLWWILLLGMVVFSAGYTALVVLAGLFAPMSPLNLESPGTVKSVYNLTVTVAYFIPLSIGVIVVTQEYRHRTIGQTLLAQPNRWIAYGAKVLTGFAFALLYGVVTIGVCISVAALLLTLNGESTHLITGQVQSTVFSSVGVLALWGAIGAGVGALLRNQVAAIIGVVVVAQFMEPILRMITAAVDRQEMAVLLPGGASDTAVGGTLYSSVAEQVDQSPAIGLLVLVGYAVVFAVVGGLRFARYEVS